MGAKHAPLPSERAAGKSAIGIRAACILLGCAGLGGCAEPAGRASYEPPLLAPPAAEAEASRERNVGQELLDAHNAERAKTGLPPLRASETLQAAAAGHARDMAQHTRMSHTGSDLSNLKVRLGREGYEFAKAGENVAMGQTSVAEVMSGWMHSRGHRRNILADYDEMGAAVARGADGKLYWCVEFGTRTETSGATPVSMRELPAHSHRRSARF